jgi:hypothetical protein
MFSYLSRNWIGQYHPGEYFSETIFENSDIRKKHFDSVEELESCLTAYHENIHFLQDIGTGFGLFCSDITERRNDDIINCLKLIDKKEKILIPVSKSLKNGSISKRNQDYLTAGLDYYNFWNDIKRQFFDSECCLSQPNSKEIARRMDTLKIIEGVPTTFSLFFSKLYGGKFDRYFFNNFENWNRSYQETILAFYSNLMHLSPQIESWKKVNSIFLLSDLSLHIPPYYFIKEKCDSGEYELTDFIPGFRFLRSLLIVRDNIGYLPVFEKDSTILKDNYLNFVNVITEHPKLRWPSMEETTEAWNAFLKSKNTSDNNLSNKWKIRMIEERTKVPQLFSSYGDYKSTIFNIIGEIPFLHKNRLKNWVYLNVDNILDRGLIENTIHENLFLNYSLYQIFDEHSTGEIICPFFHFSPFSCNYSKRDCSSQIVTSDSNYNDNQCLFGKYFNLFYDFPISQVTNSTNGGI